MRMRKKASIAVAAAAASFVGNCRSHTTFQKIETQDCSKKVDPDRQAAAQAKRERKAAKRKKDMGVQS